MAGSNKDESVSCFQGHENSQPQTGKVEQENPNPNGPDNTEMLNLPDPENTVTDEEEEKPEKAVFFLQPETLKANSSISSQLTDVSTHPISRRCSNKRKKGKGKGKLNGKKQQMLEKKIQSLTENLNTLPFIPLKTLDFPKYESLLRKLGLWDFIKIDFDNKPNKDLIVQLVAHYESRYSNVNGSRIGVNRAELARAFKMPAKKDKSNADVDLDVAPLCKESIAFMEEFLSNWMLLHDDMWIMPNEVRNWLKMINEGRPDKIDWAGLIWFMMEKELVQGEKLKNCYYAAHLQHLMKEQKVFLQEDEKLDHVVKEVAVKDVCVADANVDDITEREEKLDPMVKEVEVEDICEADAIVDNITEREDDKLDHVVKEVEVEDICEGDAKVDDITEREEEKLDPLVKEVEVEDICEGDANVEDITKREEEKLNPVVNEVEVEDICEADANDITQREEGPSIELTLGQDAEKELKVEDMEMVDSENGKDSDEEDRDGEEHVQWLMERCNNAREIEPKLDEERAVEEKFHDFAINDDAFDENGLSDNFLEAMNEDQIDFTHRVAPLEFKMDSNRSFFNQAGKRVIQQDDLISDRNKRLRIDDPCESSNGEFEMCVEKFQQTQSSLQMFYAQKQQEIEESKSATQMLLDELQKRDSMIEHLNNTRYEEIQEKDEKIHRYEKELSFMGNVLDGYKKAVKAVQKEFAEYREKVGLPEEAAYKVVGTGGLMLSVGEIERNRRKEEDEYRNNFLIFERKAKEMDEHFSRQFDLFFEKVNMLEEKLVDLEDNAKELIGLSAKRKVAQFEESGIECSGDEIEENSAEEAKSDGIAEVLCDEIAKYPTNEVEEDKLDGTFAPANEETGTNV